MRAPLQKKALVTLLCGVALPLLIGECCLRFADVEGFRQHDIRLLRDFLAEGHSRYRPYPYMGYVAQDPPMEDPVRPLDWAFDLPEDPDALRIACLGASTTFSNYPLFMKEELEARTGRTVQVMNWGVPAWTTQETMVNYFTNVQDYEPDVVILHHAANDIWARLQGSFRSDYSHFRKVWEPVEFGTLDRFLIATSNLYALWFVKRGYLGRDVADYVSHERQGISRYAAAEPYPRETESAFRRNVATVAEHVTKRGGRMVLFTMPYNLALAGNADDPARRPSEMWGAMFSRHNEVLRGLAREGDYLLVDGEAWLAHDTATLLPLFKRNDVVHFEPEGNRRKAKMVADALIDAGWLDPEFPR